MNTRHQFKHALDPNDICCEIYNPGSEEIVFENYSHEHALKTFRHPLTGELIPPGAHNRIVCKVGEWVFLPHQHYNGTVPSGSEQITVIKNFGDAMFTGNRYPSAPEKWK